MRVIVSGSLAYDRIMDFPGHFGDHILPKKIHQLNVSFNVSTFRQEFGGTAGNIAYGLRLLGVEPRIIARSGSDFGAYRTWLSRHRISQATIRTDLQATAAAHIITDQDDNQITGFFPGALGRSYGSFPKSLFTDVGLAIISPGNLVDMDRLPRELHKHQVLYFFDPGQVTTALSKATLLQGISGALGMFCNDYELAMIVSKTSLPLPQLRKRLELLIVTRGGAGSDVYAGGEQYRIPIVKPRRLVDPTGAGDAYRAGFIAGLLRGYSIETIGRFAATVAVHAVEQYGTQTYRFTSTTIRQRFNQAFGHTLE
ncbi:MAG: carbohydrate kinase family protein [Candidatus Kerfeldbacteria bacterium]|nr:carbohydrate kinase family protein [Candidatus Kerfeldbacteria bacterium]